MLANKADTQKREDCGTGTQLDALLGSGISNASAVVEIGPGAAVNKSSASQPKGFDQYSQTYLGASSAAQVVLRTTQPSCSQSAPCQLCSSFPA